MPCQVDFVFNPRSPNKRAMAPKDRLAHVFAREWLWLPEANTLFSTQEA